MKLTLKRREFMRLSATAAAAAAAPTWLACETNGGSDLHTESDGTPMQPPFDYRRAVAKPTICFGSFEPWNRPSRYGSPLSSPLALTPTGRP